MPTEPELLRAVLDDPDADAPRIAYAAHCDAEGDPRGQFVRIQLEIARLRRRDPSDPFARIRSYDADELLAAHDARWAAPVARWTSGHVFVRGFVEKITLPVRTFLEHAPELFAVAPIRHLDLTGTRAVAEELFASPHLARIRSLNLDRFGLTDEDVANLAASPHLGELQWLQLMRNDVGMDGARAMAASKGLPKLRYVGFFGNRIDPTEELVTDQGVILDRGLPADGVALEKAAGATIPWLYLDAQTPADVPPRRY
jgi:uncharacterized protein (TIGR02996 family)